MLKLELSTRRFEHGMILFMGESFESYVEEIKTEEIKILLKRGDLHHFSEEDVEESIKLIKKAIYLDFSLIFDRHDIVIDREITRMSVEEALHKYPYLKESVSMKSFWFKGKTRDVNVSRIEYEIPLVGDHYAMLYGTAKSSFSCRGTIDPDLLYLEFAYIEGSSDHAENIKRQLYGILDRLEENARVMASIQEKEMVKLETDLRLYLPALITRAKQFRQDDHLFL